MPQHETLAIDPRVLGRRLQEARKARGFTQQDAAESLAVARTTITALEKGDRQTRPDELIRLASLYGRRVSDLVGPKEPIADFAAQFRTAAVRGAPDDLQEEMRQALRDFQDLCQDYLYLEQLSGVSPGPTYPPQYPTTGTAPEEAAQDVASFERNRLGLGDGPILRLRETLEQDVGVRVFSMGMPSRVAGIFAYTDELGGCIAVNARHPGERRRWSLAHEYAHFLTSRYRSEVFLLGSHRRVPATERFADTFARCFLMPESGLRRRFNELVRASGGNVTAADVCRVAHYYFVSVEAMMLRLEELGVLPAGTWERLRDRGFKAREAQDHLGLPPHPSDDRLLPSRYEFLAARAHEVESLTEGELARLLRTDRVSARRTLQRLGSALHVLDGGEVASLPIELAGSVTKPDS